jgi:hypothetical protein
VKSYLITTGLLFALLTLAHIWRAIEEGPGIAADPWFTITTIAATGLCTWAWRLLRGLARS